jgi:4'-phosphopantetheinyl transferase EntD
MLASGRPGLRYQYLLFMKRAAAFSTHCAVPHPGPAGLLTSLLPAGVAVADLAGHGPAAGGWLFPEEEVAVRTARAQRRADFTAGRMCARAALARLGMPPAAILPGPAGEPRWPAGVTGSITHCAGYRAAAVALTSLTVGIGIDAEPASPLPASLLDTVASAAEKALIARRAAAAPAVCWDRLLFSVKEAACKLWYPLTGHWPGLHRVEAGLSPAGTFTARMPTSTATGPGPAPLTGRWLARHRLIITAVAIPAGCRPGQNGAIACCAASGSDGAAGRLGITWGDGT